MKILVTGGTGFTGAMLVLRLLEIGHTVRSLDNQPGIFYDTLKKQGAELVTGSITDKKTVMDAMTGMEFVFHLAAAFRKLNVPDSYYYDVNVNGTRNVLEAAEACNVKRVVYCSTQGVHGHVTQPPGNENSPIAPADYYQQTKYEGEEVTQEFIKKGLNCIILRPTAIYGPGDPERFFMIFKRVKKGMFPMFGSGKTFYHPLYIDNLVDAFVLTLDLDKGKGGVYLIADEEYVPIKTLVEKVAAAMQAKVKIPHFPFTPMLIIGHIVEKLCKPFGITPPIFPRRVDWFRQVRAFDITKARTDLGYVPRVGLDEGLRKTAEWYKSEGYL